MGVMGGSKAPGGLMGSGGSGPMVSCQHGVLQPRGHRVDGTLTAAMQTGGGVSAFRASDSGLRPQVNMHMAAIQTCVVPSWRYGARANARGPSAHPTHACRLLLLLPMLLLLRPQAPGSMGAVGAAAPAPPPQPSGPPAHITMATADVSKVPADQKAILGSLNNLFNFCMQAANTPGGLVLLAEGLPLACAQSLPFAVVATRPAGKRLLQCVHFAAKVSRTAACG
jgi:hypothetical protein